MPVENIKNKIGGLLILLNKNKIWIRAYAPHTAIYIHSIEEMIEFISKITNDELLIITSYRDNLWAATTLQFSDSKLELEKGLTHKIFSWSGKYNKIIKAQKL